MTKYRYGIALLIYAVLIAAAGIWFTRKDPWGSYIAARGLVRNHRIVAGDLRKPFDWPSSAGWYLPNDDALNGQYVVSDPVAPCARVTSANTASSPNFQVGGGLNLVTLPLPDGSPLIWALDAGSTVELVGPKDETKIVAVQAIVCDPGTTSDKSASCHAVFAVSAPVEDFVTKNRTAIRILPKIVIQPETCKGEVSVPQPTWRKIAENKQIPEEVGLPWTKVLDYVTPGKLMKIEVVTDSTAVPRITGRWKPAGFHDECTADGDFTAKEPVGGGAVTPLLSSAPVGALIARIGGSTADQTVDSGTTPNRLIFSAGRHYVFLAPNTPNGALYLGVNDTAPRMQGLTLHLVVDIYEAI